MAIVFENAALHNVAELVPTEHGPRLQRVPETLRGQLNPGAQGRMLDPAGMEVRFVSSGPVTITLSAPGADEQALPIAEVFFGTFSHWLGRGAATHRTIGTTPTPIRIEPPKRLPNLPAEVADRMPFAPAVHRLVLPLFAPSLVIHSIEAEAGDLRPPRPEELPGRTMLSYGTSITHGAGASGAHLTYPNQCGVRLGVDVVNLGSGGSCHCEPQLADWIAGRTDWHLATLALSVNMIGFSDADFEERVEYFVNTVAGANADRPIFAITLWPYFADHGMLDEQPDLDPARAAFAENRRQILRDVVQRSGKANLHLLEGPDLLRDFGGLSQDLIHPGDHAMIEMGWRLADAIRPHLAAGPLRGQSASPVAGSAS